MNFSRVVAMMHSSMVPRPAEGKGVNPIRFSRLVEGSLQ